jgi:hypothetical protein
MRTPVNSVKAAFEPLDLKLSWGIIYAADGVAMAD